MFDAVLRVYGEQFDVATCLEQHSDLLISESYQKGELDMFGNPNSFSGFDVIVAENTTAAECQQQVRAFLTQHAAMLTGLQQDKVHCELDIDMTVSDDDQIPESLSLPIDLLAQLVRLDIGLELSAFPDTDLDAL